MVIGLCIWEEFNFIYFLYTRRGRMHLYFLEIFRDRGDEILENRYHLHNLYEFRRGVSEIVDHREREHKSQNLIKSVFLFQTKCWIQVLLLKCRFQSVIFHLHRRTICHLLKQSGSLLFLRILDLW